MSQNASFYHCKTPLPLEFHLCFKCTYSPRSKAKIQAFDLLFGFVIRKLIENLISERVIMWPSGFKGATLRVSEVELLGLELCNDTSPHRKNSCHKTHSVEANK